MHRHFHQNFVNKYNVSDPLLIVKMFAEIKIFLSIQPTFTTLEAIKYHVSTSVVSYILLKELYL
jgi:hypothetical protein